MPQRPFRLRDDIKILKFFIFLCVFFPALFKQDTSSLPGTKLVPLAQLVLLLCRLYHSARVFALFVTIEEFKYAVSLQSTFRQARKKASDCAYSVSDTESDTV